MPLAVLRREMPKELKMLTNTAYKKTYSQSEKYKEYQRNINNQKNIKNTKKYYQNKKAKAKEEMGK